MTIPELTLSIVNAISPLLVGILGMAATLFGAGLHNRWQEKRKIDNLRSKTIGSLFANINEAERNIIKIHSCINTKQDAYYALQASIESVKKLLNEYDKSAVFLPESIAQIVETVINRVNEVNANVLMNNHLAISKDMSSVENDLKCYKKELREVFQKMIGVIK